jgi:succinoglycan biosynthesis protein ExoL
LKSISRVRKKVVHFDLIYASGQDVAALGYLASIGLKKKVVMEVGDIVNIQVRSGFWGKLVRFIDRFFAKNYGLIVAISPGFLEGYYVKRLNLKVPTLVIENKIEADLSYSELLPPPLEYSKVGKPFSERRFRIGYFGLLRDSWSWEVLSTLVNSYPERYEIWVAGKIIEPPNLKSEIKKSLNVKYLGEYNSPKDLRKLYDSVDMVWACYPKIGVSDWNLRWGRPNRFYESCFFGRPIFSRAGSHFSMDVEREQIGFCINGCEINDVLNEILSIDYEQFIKLEKNIKKIPSSIYLYTNETQLLAAEIKKLIS